MPKLCRATDDAREISEAWEAYAGRTHADVKVRTPHGPRRAHVLFRAGSWVVTARDGDDGVRLTLGPTGMAVGGVTGRTACLDLLSVIVEAGYRDAAGVSGALGAVIDTWARCQEPAANERPRQSPSETAGPSKEA